MYIHANYQGDNGIVFSINKQMHLPMPPLQGFVLRVNQHSLSVGMPACIEWLLQMGWKCLWLQIPKMPFHKSTFRKALGV